jgi:hypothetical protein
VIGIPDEKWASGLLRFDVSDCQETDIKAHLLAFAARGCHLEIRSPRADPVRRPFAHDERRQDRQEASA